MCVKDYVYVYDGVPLYPGFSSEGATLLAALCGSNVDETLSVTAVSGVMTVFFEAFVDPSSASLSCVSMMSSFTALTDTRTDIC